MAKQKQPRERGISHHRVKFLDGVTGVLEQELFESIPLSPDQSSERVMEYSTGLVYSASIRRETKSGLFMRLRYWVPGEEALAMEKPRLGSEGISVVLPGQDSEFVKNELFLLICGNQVFCIANNGARPAMASAYFSWALERSGNQAMARALVLVPEASETFKNLIRDRQVKGIEYSVASALGETTGLGRRQNLVKRGVANIARVLFGIDPDEDVGDVPIAMLGKVIFNADGRSKPSKKEQRKFDKFATQLVSDNGVLDGFVIALKGGAKLRGDKLIEKTIVEIPPHANSLSEPHVYEKLAQHFHATSSR